MLALEQEKVKHDEEFDKLLNEVTRLTAAQVRLRSGFVLMASAATGTTMPTTAKITVTSPPDTEDLKTITNDTAATTAAVENEKEYVRTIAQDKTMLNIDEVLTQGMVIQTAPPPPLLSRRHTEYSKFGRR